MKKLRCLEGPRKQLDEIYTCVCLVQCNRCRVEVMCIYGQNVRTLRTGFFEYLLGTKHWKHIHFPNNPVRCILLFAPFTVEETDPQELHDMPHITWIISGGTKDLMPEPKSSQIFLPTLFYRSPLEYLAFERNTLRGSGSVFKYLRSYHRKHHPPTTLLLG